MEWRYLSKDDWTNKMKNEKINFTVENMGHGPCGMILLKHESGQQRPLGVFPYFASTVPRKTYTQGLLHSLT